KPVFALAVSPDKAVRLAPVLGSLGMVFMDRREAIAFADVGIDTAERDIIDRLRRAGLKYGVVRSDDGPVLGFDEAGAFSIPPPRKVTGVAADALAGATVAALLRGLTLRAALRDGVAAAMLAIESAELVPVFTAADFADALALVPEPQKIGMRG
ncbi:PfkB family carbohydrate kinase, partial [Mesorhizobium sp.]